jgi:hypothetical protein
VCSVLFCDVRVHSAVGVAGSGGGAELLCQYFERARTVVGRYGGWRSSSDAVMVVWGTPVAAEGDAERAVRTALDLVSAVADLGAEGVAGSAARAAVVTTVKWLDKEPNVSSARSLWCQAARLRLRASLGLCHPKVGGLVPPAGASLTGESQRPTDCGSWSRDGNLAIRLQINYPVLTGCQDVVS